MPNVSGAALVSNFVSNTGFAKDSNQFDVKVDTTLRSAEHLTLRYRLQRVSTFTAPTFGLAGGNNLDASLMRNLALTERVDLKMRLKAFQVSNTPTFTDPTRSLTSSDFGSITKAGGNRQLQIAATLTL